MGDNSKLNTIILGVATFGTTTLMGILMMQIADVNDKVETVRTNQQAAQLETVQRLTKVEAKLEQVVREVKQ